MQKLGVAAGFLGLLANAVLPPAPSVEVIPLFWKGQDKPAFAVQCRNNSGLSRDKLDYIVKSSAFRLDGALHERQGFVGSILGPTEVVNGGIFRQLVVFGESPGRPLDVAGSWVMTPWDLPIKPGEYRVAFRCWSDWSAEHRFVWAGPERESR